MTWRGVAWHGVAWRAVCCRAVRHAPCRVLCHVPCRALCRAVRRALAYLYMHIYVTLELQSRHMPAQTPHVQAATCAHARTHEHTCACMYMHIRTCTCTHVSKCTLADLQPCVITTDVNELDFGLIMDNAIPSFQHNARCTCARICTLTATRTCAHTHTRMHTCWKIRLASCITAIRLPGHSI